ncbi:hypothetical protein MJH12_15660 [bacterium]|nr:hypothetical protein [bacterium]
MTVAITDIEKFVHLLCVKCSKPLTLNWEIKIDQCPYCNDLFNSKSQIHLLLGEKQMEYQQKLPFSILHSFPKFNLLVLAFGFIYCFFLSPTIWSYTSAAFLLFLIANLYRKFHKNHRKIKDIEHLIMQLQDSS